MTLQFPADIVAAPAPRPHGQTRSSTGTDGHIGARVRLRRRLLGLHQSQIAAALGITSQQLQKYERGVNRISASRLFDLARVLDVPIGYFFNDAQAAVEPGREPDRPFQDQQSQELLAAFNGIADPAIRKNIAALAKTWAASQQRSG